MKIYDAPALLEEMQVAIRNGHFIYPDDMHSGSWFDTNLLYAARHRLKAEAIVLCMVEQFLGSRVSLVISRRSGSALAHLVAEELRKMTSRRIEELIVTHRNAPMLEDEQNMVAGKNVLIVEEAICEDSWLDFVVFATKKFHGSPIGITSIANTTVDVAPDHGVKTFSLVDICIEKFTEEECFDCANQVSVNTKVGHGQKFSERKKSKRFLIGGR